VACSDLRPLREIGGEACWYYDQTKPEEIARVIADCLQADASMAQQRGIAQAKLFSWELCGQQTWQVLLRQVD
jgi:glycosyltransferase involved in cell wall biosynthesis